MIDAWVLAFVVNGFISSSGFTMDLQDCRYHQKYMPPEYSQAVCINIQDPSCKIYKDVPEHYTFEKRCLQRLKTRKEEE